MVKRYTYVIPTGDKESASEVSGRISMFLNLGLGSYLKQRRKELQLELLISFDCSGYSLGRLTLREQSTRETRAFQRESTN